jgi:hypothetical protein
MKRTFAKLMVLLSLFVVLEVLALFATAAEPLLTLVHADQEREWYINTRTLVSPSPGAVSLWSKIVPAKGGAYDMRVREVMKQAGRNPGRLEYVQVLEEIDCVKNSVKVWSVLFYDRQDRIVMSSPVAQALQPALDIGDGAASIRKLVCMASFQDRATPVRIAHSAGAEPRAVEIAQE